ncbi:unnamed protein product [Polarella glacialis]|uniref:Fibronectin type-III domain-containing protein n=1 Tax=Polarella glacialis TaxID=89957 RepID=A0A813HQW3_POLGL|nr:unnamed protein product [Polarella glacialis]
MKPIPGGALAFVAVLLAALRTQSTADAAAPDETSTGGSVQQQGAAPPRSLAGQGVTNAAWLDTDTRWGFVGGVISWTPPAVTANVDSYQVWICGYSADDMADSPTGANIWDSELQDPLIPVGTNTMNIYSNTRRALNGNPLSWENSDPPARWFQVYASVNGQIQTRTELDDSAVIGIYDTPGNGPIVIPFDNSTVTFSDTDNRRGYIGGSVSWEIPPKYDFTHIQTFEVFLAIDELCNDPSSSWVVPGSSSAVVLPNDLLIGNRRFFCVVAHNTDGSHAPVVKMMIDDTGGLPTQGVTNLHFTDEDTDPGEISGLLTWDFEFVATASNLLVYLARDQSGSGRIPLCAACEALPRTKLELTVPADTDLVGRDYFVVYTKNEHGMQATPAFLLISDKTIGGPPAMSALVQSIEFSDQDSGFQQVDGTVRWTPGGESDVGSFVVCLGRSANAAIGDAGLTEVGEVSRGTYQVALGPMSILNDDGRPYNFILIFAKNQFGTAASANSITLEDNKTLCTDDVDPCPANSVYKAVLPGGCSTGVCTAEECCDVAGQCSSDPNASDSIVCSGDHVLKVPPPSSCTGFQCTKSDCCSQVSLPPGNVTISSPSPTSLQLAWEVPLFGDCTFLQYQIQWRRDADANAWQEVPAGCTLLNQACDSSCMASNLPSNTAVRFRARVQCALLMDNVFSVFNSSWSGESLPASTLLIPPASPTNLILSSYSDSSVFLSWLAPPSLGPDCTFADWLVELRDDSQNVDWTAQSACTGLALEGECDVLGLHCETSYSLRVAVKCAQPQLFGAFSSAKSFQTTKGQECFRAALAPSGVVASAPSTSAMNVSWTPGLAQDCIFAEWLVEVRPQNRATWSQAQGCEGLATRTTTSCTAIGLKSLTAHEFRVQEVCSDSSLTSDWHTSLFSPMATLVLPAAAPLGLTSLSPTFSSASLSWELPELNDCIFLGYVVRWRYNNASGAGAWRSASDASSCQRASVGAGASGQTWSVCSTGCTTEDLPSNTRLGFQVGVGCSNADAVSVWSSLAYATTPPRPMASPTGLSATVITEESSATVSWQAGLLFDCIFAGWTVERFDGAWEAQCEVTNISQTSCRLIDLPCSSRIQVRVFGRCQDPLANSGYSATKEFVTAPVGCVEIGSPPSSVNASMPTVSSLLVAWTAATASGNCNFTQWEVQSQPQTQASWVAAAGCEGLTTRGVTTCTATGLRSLTVHMFRVREVCGGNQSAGAWGYADLVSTLIKASAQPGSVVGSNPATHEMRLEWERPNLNDCVFKKYLLAWRKAGDFASQWATPEGCKDLVSACTSACIARGLPANTSLEFRVALSCTPTEANSIWSNASAIVSTLPVPAAPPTGLLQGSIAASSATVSWQAGTLNDCLFSAWLVEVRDVSNGIPWTAQTSCAGQSYNGATCSITGLTCSSVIEVRVQAICADPLANSPVSVVTSFTTPGGDACLQPASPPSSVNASMPTVSSLLVSWAAATGSQNCSFAQWEVQIQPQTQASWVAAEGCDGLTTRGMTTCSAAGLRSLTAHKFRVREVCQLSQTTGAWGESAVAVFTLAIPAAAPEGVTALSPSFRSMQVSWSPPKLNDCVFRSSVVEWRLLVSPSGWAEASCAGAAAATSGACDAGCQATGLPSRTALSFRARVLCSDEGTSSTWSSEAVATTLHRRAESPVAPAVLDVSIFSARVTWPLAGSPLASALHDCGGSEFLGWRVELQDASSGERWGAPPPHTASASDSDSCNATMPASAQGCNLTGLSCNTHYAVRLAPLCSQPEASPLLPGQEQNFSTLASQQCLRRASSPAGIVGLLPSFTGLQLSWVPGQANDCTFLAWDVKLYVSAPSESFLPQGCDGLSVRELTSCFAAGLSDGTSYQISVQELCAEAVLASPLGVSSLPATTLEVPAPEVLLQLPSPGEIVGQRPQALLMMFSVPVSAENIPRLSLCAVGAGCPQNGCQELGSDAASFSLKSSRLASWAANSSMWQQGCSYEVRLQAGSFETLAQPAKQQAEITWGFTYNATLPALLGPASLALAATEQLELVVAWTASVEFLCRARRSTGSTTSLGAPQLVALGVPATFQLQGLRPGSIYDIECQGSLQDDPSVTSSWLPAGRAATLQDSNADLSELKLLATPICPGGQQLESQVADATPAFDPNVTSYDVVLVSSDFLFACNLAGQETTTEAVWQLSLASTSQSSYAIVSETSWGASSSSSGGLRLLSLPVAEATVSLTGVVSVTSMAGPVRSYQVQVMALRLNFDVGIPKLTTVTGADVSLQPLEEGRSLEVQVNYSSSSALAAEVWSRLQIFLGPFPQTTLAIPVTGTTSGGGAQQYHLVVLAMLGVGRDLPLQLRLGDALVGQAPSMMSFVDPVVSCISSTGYGSCSAAALEAMEVILATVGETMIFVKGSGFGSHPMLAQAGPLAEQLLRLAVTRESSAVRSLELCADSAWASSSELWCRLLPQVAPPLSLALLGPTGRKLTTDGSGSAPAAAVANSWEVAPLIDLQWTAAYAPPVVSELSSMDLPLSGGGQLFIVGSGFPNFTSDLPRVQLQPGSQSSARLRRLQASGSDALCAPLVRVNDTHLFCNLSSFLNLSSWGCSSMDLEVVWGNLRSQLQAPALRVPKPQITTVTEVSPGPDGNVEIGTGSTFEVQGRGFGTDGNGPIVLKVGDVLCDVSARTDTRLFCSIDGQLRSDLLPFYPAAENHRSGAVEVAVEINITVILGGDSSAGRAGGSGNGGCEPVAATWTQHRVRLLPCPAGTRRSSKDTMACEACAAGRYTSADAPFSLAPRVPGDDSSLEVAASTVWLALLVRPQRARPQSSRRPANVCLAPSSQRTSGVQMQLSRTAKLVLQVPFVRAASCRPGHCLGTGCCLMRVPR